MDLNSPQAASNFLITCEPWATPRQGFRPTQPELIARKLRDVEAHLHATPEYLQSVGNSTSALELGKAELIGFDGHQSLIQLLDTRGFKLAPSNFQVAAENRIAQWQLVKAVAGIGIMPADVGDPEPSVQRVLPGDEPIAGELWLAAHGELKTSRRVRMVFDFLVSEFS